MHHFKLNGAVILKNTLDLKYSYMMANLYPASTTMNIFSLFTEVLHIYFFDFIKHW